MKITVVYGETQIQVSGSKSLKKLKNTVIDLINSIPEQEVEEEEEPNPIGFSVSADTQIAPETVDYIWDDDGEYEW